MFESLEILVLGTAAVVETALFLILLERINRPHAPPWLRLLVGGAWLWHVCSLLHVLLRDVSGPTAAGLDQLLMAGMALGLLLMPSGMLHAAVRLYVTGLDPGARPRVWMLMLYLPLLAFPWVGVVIMHTGSRDFMVAVSPLRDVYLLWLVVANSVGVLFFLAARIRLPAGARMFLTQLTSFLVLMTLLVVAYTLGARETAWEPGLRIVTSVAPLFPALLFAWHAVQQQLIPLVLERTIVYGATLVAILLLHRLTVSSVAEALQRTSRFDFYFMEGLLLIAVVLLWKRLRGRVREALRYLMSDNVRATRDATRRLSVELSRRPRQSEESLVTWFQDAVGQAVECVHCTVWLRDAASGHWHPPENDRNATSQRDSGTDDLCQRLADACTQHGDSYMDRGEVVAGDVVDLMERADAMWLFRLHFQSVQGIVRLGSRCRHDRLSDEQLAALGMLCDQFAATLHNRRLEEARGVAERRAMQSEKLSVLGLLAGSIAHELRNPLSSMRTITQLAMEELGDAHACTADLKMVVREIDRLNQTTGRLLEFSRPSGEQAGSCQPDSVIDRMLHILGHLARQHHVTLKTTLMAGSAMVAVSEAVVSEIFFNLLKNAVEAVREQADGLVEIRSAATADVVEFIVADNGPGIAPHLLTSLCEPFVTDKVDGTGLGLFVVSERIREAGGHFECGSGENGGSQFVVQLPRHRQNGAAESHFGEEERTLGSFHE